MPKKAKDPLHAVLDYFETAPLEEAEKALGLVGRAVKARRPIVTQSKPKARKGAKRPQDRPLPIDGAPGDQPAQHG